MNGIAQSFRRFGFMAILLLPVVSLRADPIEINEVPIVRVGTIFTITFAILLEAICVLLLLRRRRTPRFFILWLMGMHLFTYPLFLALVWLAMGLHPVLVVTLAEGLIVLVEGSLIYFMCHVAPSPKKELPFPSFGKNLFVSLVGNACSAAAFPLLMILYAWIISSVE